MTTGHLRDEQQLASGIEAWLAHGRPDRAGTRVERLRRPSTGWSNETLLVDTVGPRGAERLVVRLPPLLPSYPEHGLHAQADVHRAVLAAGLPAPAVLAVEDDPAWLGAPFLVLAHITGRVAGEAPGLDPWIADATPAEQRRVQDGFVVALADLHRVDVSGSHLTTRLRVGVTDEITYWIDYVTWATDGSPPRAMVDALAWCRATARPGLDEWSLLWGDARLGNVMYDDARDVVAILDWELATIGPAEMDLAWYVALDELTTKATGAAVPGFRDREDLVTFYEQRLGRPVERLAWHQIFALTRSIAINDRQARLAAATGVPYPGAFGEDNPMLRYLGRRIERYTEVS